MSQSCSAVCTPNWQCSGFESCMNGQQTQTCTDTNNCGVTNNEPALIQSCSTQSTQPTITNVSPNQGGANSTMTITGTNLSGIVEVYFYSNGQYKFSASSISPTDQNHMNFSISPVLAANENSGTYQIKAVTATGTTSNSLDFTFNATTASTTSSPAYCELIGIGTFTPNQTAPDTGSGYAKISKTGISTIAQLQAACSDSDWETLLSNYCGASNSATAYKSLVIYNAQGTPSISSGVGQNMPVNCP